MVSLSKERRSTKSVQVKSPGGTGHEGYPPGNGSVRLKDEIRIVDGCAARTASPSCAAKKESTRTSITGGRRNSWKQARSGLPATRCARRPATK